MFQPSPLVLRKYADLLVTFALNGGRGVQPKQVVQLNVPDTAKPLFEELLRAVLDAGAYPKTNFIPTKTDRLYFEHASDDQLVFFAEKFKRAEADLVDASITIISDADPSELRSIDPVRIFQAMDARRVYRDWLYTKEQRGAYSWTLALFGTEAMAKEAGMSLEEYWQQILRACYLDAADPVAEWRKIQSEQDRVKAALDALEIASLHIEGERIDLTVKIGPNRKWLGGSCRNIPSFEIFISPDWRGTEGKIFFNQPLYRYGNILRDIALEWKEGRVVRASARVGQAVLDSMIARKNADKIGEYSLTDKRSSRITTFMANTLYDENIGGQFGNTHLALGRAYKDSFPGDQSKPTVEDWERWGYNDSPEHTDIISTEDRLVTASLSDGSTKVIFKEGMFTV